MADLFTFRRSSCPCVSKNRLAFLGIKVDFDIDTFNPGISGKPHASSANIDRMASFLFKRA